ncbi:MAG: sce7726 family protein [Patescibacteria group bacterium]|nr:sce7726 family protein [Patescibacteria group bacterium]
MLTSDKLIRKAFKKDLKNHYKNSHRTRIIEELGIIHGAARIDIAVINGVIHGYEFKSDIDTLYRLPEQMKIYNTTLDKVTLIVGKNHLYEAINIVPDWWGIMIAKVNTDNKVVFYTIRKAENNPEQVGISVARLLWRKEALQILEEKNMAVGFRSKPRDLIYKRLASVLDTETLKERVRYTLLVSRKDWRSDLQLMPSGDLYQS